MIEVNRMSILESNEVRTDQISLTDTAHEKIGSLIEERNLEGYALRVFVSGGGCSGMQYGMGLDAETQDNDHQFDFKGIRVIIDPQSMGFLAGSTIDYMDDLMGGGFKIDNPNAIVACGCGNSFRTEDHAKQATPSNGSATGACCG
jgi:iron-sulfur cluster assembly accessory protein